MVIHELDSEGHLTATFTYSATTKAIQTRHPARSVSTKTSLLMRLMDVFLPVGYPSSVTLDYTPYQIYDTLQAFASTIAGLLASRAVFVGMGVGSEDASLVTTMLLYIAQETIGRVATILFAHQFSQRIEAEVKFYRFFADIVNDVAFVLDCLSPGLPVLGRVCTLCVSNACRAVCGVSGGSSKAILSSHFAKAGNIGELNAKDGSQETVVSLVGMWIGGLVVSKVHGTFETWCCLIPLLALHLWANWKAVKSVRLRSLNTERAFILFSALLQGKVKDVNEVGGEESILGLGKVSSSRSNVLRVGVSVTEFLHNLPGGIDESQRHRYFGHLLKLFEKEDYLLWRDDQMERSVVLLKESATGETQAKAICHFCRTFKPVFRLAEAKELLQQPTQNAEEHHLSQSVASSGNDIRSSNSREANDIRGRLSRSVDKGDQTFQVVCDALRQNGQEWQNLRDQVERAGWDLSLTNLVGGRCNRIRTHDRPVQNKKDL